MCRVGGITCNVEGFAGETGAVDVQRSSLNYLPIDNSVVSASVVCSFLLKQSCRPLSITTIWSKDISGDLQTLFSDQIWETITSSSKSPDHRMIHLKLLHGLCLSPLGRFCLHVSPFQNCSLCPQDALSCNVM